MPVIHMKLEELFAIACDLPSWLQSDSWWCCSLQPIQLCLVCVISAEISDLALGSTAVGCSMLTEGHKALLDAQRTVLGVSDASADQARPRSRSISPRQLLIMGAGCAAHRPRRRR
eukprot:COSAG01_NODE_18090_length_1101_cov_2.766467_2_plen_116_part_00